MSAYDALLGTLSQDGIAVELGNGLNFTGGLTLTPNATTGKIDVGGGGSGGGGDITGPGSSVDDRIATWNGTAGDTLQDSGYTIANVLTVADSAADAGDAAVAALIPVAGGAPANVTKAAAAAGAAGTWSRSDHKHDVTTAAPGTVTFGAAAEGSATSLARSDHAHALTTPGAPADVTKAAASAGSSANVARQDHKHDVSTAAVSAVNLASVSAAEGSATSLARSDHTHSLSGILPVALGGDGVGWNSGSNGANSDTTYNISDGNYFVVPASMISGGTKKYTWAYSGSPQEGEIVVFDVYGQSSDLQFIDSTIGTGTPVCTVANGSTKWRVILQYNGANWLLALRRRFP